MDIKHKQGKKGMFYLGDENEPQAAMSYSLPSSHQMIIEHTEVSDELRGKNVGYNLVKSAVEFARENKIKIIPLCPFAASVFRKKTAFADVLK